MRSGSVNVICITLAISPFEAFYELVEAFNCRRTGAARGLEQLISNNHYTNAGLKASPTGPWTCSGTGHPIGGLNPAARLIVPFLLKRPDSGGPIARSRAFSRPFRAGPRRDRREIAGTGFGSHALPEGIGLRRSRKSPAMRPLIGHHEL